MKPSELKVLRLQASLTQKEMAEKMGLNPRMYQKYEGGSTPIRKVVALAAQHVVHCLKGHQPQT